MTNDQIIRLAQEAGLPTNIAWLDSIMRFAAAVAGVEREARARVCGITYEGAFEGARPCFDTPQECAAAIRARGSHE